MPFRQRRILSVLLLAAGAVFPQTTAKDQTLTVKGFTGQVPVLQVNGKSYVEVEALARLANGSVAFQPGKITLTLAGVPGSAASPAPAPTPVKINPSRDFLRAAIEELTVIREWRIAVVNAVQSNFPVSQDWLGTYERNAEAKLALATAAASRDPDRDLLQLLNDAFNGMKSLNDKYVGLHSSLTYIPPDSLANDAQNQQVLNCAQGLASLVAIGQVEDVAVCHF